jgi:hypothetical protein
VWKVPKEEKVKENTKKQRKRGNNKHMSIRWIRYHVAIREEWRELVVDFYVDQMDTIPRSGGQSYSYSVTMLHN